MDKEPARQLGQRGMPAFQQDKRWKKKGRRRTEQENGRVENRKIKIIERTIMSKRLHGKKTNADRKGFNRMVTKTRLERNDRTKSHFYRTDEYLPDNDNRMCFQFGNFRRALLDVRCCRLIQDLPDPAQPGSNSFHLASRP